MTRTDLETLIRAVEEGSTSRDSEDHGPQHWRCVALTGIRLARQTPGASPLIAFLFGLFHDARRENDYWDPGHGERGAQLAETFQARGLLTLLEQNFADLLLACKTHTEADPTDNPVIGICYDADRLNLWRVRVRPNSDFLSTDAGKASCRAQDTRFLHWSPLSWSQVLDTLFDPTGTTAELPQHR